MLTDCSQLGQNQRERRGVFRIELETYGLLNDRQFDIKKAVELFGTLLAFTEIRSVLARAQDAPLVLREVFAVGEGTLDRRDAQTGGLLITLPPLQNGVYFLGVEGAFFW